MRERANIVTTFVSFVALLTLFGGVFWRPAAHESSVITLIEEGGGDSDEFVERILATRGDERTKLIEAFQESDLQLYSSEPDEFHFSDARGSWGAESSWSQLLADGDLGLRITAAGVLWQKHSGLHTRQVLKFLDEEKSESNEMQTLRRTVEESFHPDSILRELRQGDHGWGAWLAFLRPDAGFVPTLLENLEADAEQRPETLMALGKTRDRRAFEPLRKFLLSNEHIASGFAAEAMGHLGFSEGEPLLIDALTSDNGWLQVNACQGLSLIGTRRSIPALERLATDERYTGALSIQEMARRAIESINARNE